MMPYITDQMSKPHITDQILVGLGPQFTDETFAQSREQLTERLREFKLTPEDLIMKVLKYLHHHMVTWCDKRKLNCL
jgi:hypothetical protein